MFNLTLDSHKEIKSIQEDHFYWMTKVTTPWKFQIQVKYFRNKQKTVNL